MGFLNDIMHDDLRFGLHSTDEHGESVTITKADATTYTVNAVVNRSVEPTPEEESQGVKEVMFVSLENHSTRGVAVESMNAGTWRVTVAFRIGETARTYILGRPVSIDAAELVFRIK